MRRDTQKCFSMKWSVLWFSDWPVGAQSVCQRQLHTGVSHLPTTTALLRTYTMALTPRQ